MITRTDLPYLWLLAAYHNGKDDDGHGKHGYDEEEAIFLFPCEVVEATLVVRDGL